MYVPDAQTSQTSATQDASDAEEREQIRGLRVRGGEDDAGDLAGVDVPALLVANHLAGLAVDGGNGDDEADLVAVGLERRADGRSVRKHSLAWYLADDRLHTPLAPGCATPLQVSYDVCNKKAAGGMRDKDANDLIESNKKHFPPGNTYPPCVSPLIPVLDA